MRFCVSPLKCKFCPCEKDPFWKSNLPFPANSVLSHLTLANYNFLRSAEEGAANVPRVPFAELPMNARVKMKVSGQNFVTTVSTIAKQPSTLPKILDSAPIDPQGFILLPTSSQTFNMVLCYLRDGVVDPRARVDVRCDLTSIDDSDTKSSKVPVPLTRRSRNQLMQDAVFFGISGLVRVVRELDLEDEAATIAEGSLPATSSGTEEAEVEGAKQVVSSPIGAEPNVVAFRGVDSPQVKQKEQGLASE